MEHESTMDSIAQAMKDALNDSDSSDNSHHHFLHRHRHHKQVVPTPAPESATAPPKAENELSTFMKLLKSKEKVAKLHFYVQDALGGPSATVWEVARSPITANSSSSFGQVRVLDDKITETPDKDSKELGRAQGMITFTGMDESALTMNLNFYFSSGQYSGSSICVIGRNPISSTNRELPVVGGTGVFRMARGYTISNTYSYDAAANYGVLEYTIYVSYLDVEED